VIREQRRLAAIVSADVAAYSRLMSPPGPSRHFAPPHDFGRNRGVSEVDGRPFIAAGDARRGSIDKPVQADDALRFLQAVIACDRPANPDMESSPSGSGYHQPA
jgi:hypothetical protein